MVRPISGLFERGRMDVSKHFVEKRPDERRTGCPGHFGDHSIFIRPRPDGSVAVRHGKIFSRYLPGAALSQRAMRAVGKEIAEEGYFVRQIYQAANRFPS